MKTNEIHKSFAGEPRKADAKNDIDLINKYSLREMSPEEIFAFNVNLCDSQIDRDLEAFSVLSLRKLQSLFIGKPLIVDHEWSANNQTGRIYDTQLVKDGTVHRLRASIYMVRSSGTNETIRQIEGGVLREVSVCCRIARHVCSVCGEDMSYDPRDWEIRCRNGHTKGETLDGKLVHCVLEDPTDAYEVSLVAVPAQPDAGITKGISGTRNISAEEWAERRKAFEKALGCQVPDEAWDAIIKGRVSGSEVATVFRKKEALTKEPKYYGDIVPADNYSNDAIKFAIIPGTAIDEGTRIAAYRALGFCRKELQLQPISIRWFCTSDYAQRLGLDPKSLKFFRAERDLLGLASRQNPNQILLRYPRSYEGLMKTTYHECWHTFQMKDEYSSLHEDGAYWYMEDAFKRYSALSEKEKEELFDGELLMKDYSRK